MRNDVNIARWAEKQGYTIAGFAEDLFEGAEFTTLPSYIEGEEPTEDELRHVTRGKVLDIVSILGDRGDEGYDEVDQENDRRHDAGEPLLTPAEQKAILAKYHGNFLVNFVYQTEDGTQIATSFGRSLGLRFKDPKRS